MPVEDDLDGEGFDEDELEFQSRALEIVLEELTRPPAVGLATLDTAGRRPGAMAADDGGSTDWSSSPVQSFTLEKADRGDYSTRIMIFALHSCAENKDFYLVNTIGDWTPTEARFQSASKKSGTLERAGPLLTDLDVNWQNNRANCRRGTDVCTAFPCVGNDNVICRYRDYPLFYEVAILPPSGPRVVQINAAPAGSQGRDTSFTKGVSFSIGGGVDVSGSGPSGGFSAGVSWDNSATVTVPALLIEAGNVGNQGTFTRYRYCTTGSMAQDCTSTIQMTAPSPGDICQRYVVGQPQQGQTPNGRLSDVAQTVRWVVDPATYTGATFDITVKFEAALAESTSKLWVQQVNVAPGHCNGWGCNCAIDTGYNSVKLSHTLQGAGAFAAMQSAIRLARDPMRRGAQRAFQET